MKISPIKNRSKVITVHDSVGAALIKSGKFVEAGKPTAYVVVAESDVKDIEPPGVDQEVEISPRTGLPKRVYRRRDMESE